MEDGFEKGLLTGLLLVVFIILIGMVGGVITSSSIRSDCKDFGKSEIKGTWYECKEIKPSDR